MILDTFTIYNAISIMTLALSLLLATFVYLNNKQSKINKTYFLMVLGAILWIFSNFITDLSADTFTITLWSKLTLIGPILIGFFFFRLSTFFPREKKVSKLNEWFVGLGAVLLLSFVPTGLNISGIFIADNGIPAIYPGPLYIYFLVYFVITFFLSFVNLFHEYKRFDRTEQLQVLYISLGVGLSAILGITTNLILPLFDISQLVNYGPYFILVFVFFSAYAVIKYKLFDVKVIATQLFVFALSIFIFLRLLFQENIQDKLLSGGLLVLVIIFGIFLIRSVIKEIEQREKIQALAKDLGETNERQEKLIHFIGHEVKGYLTKGEYAFSEMVDGDFGKLSPEVQTLSTAALAELRKGVASVTDILKAANLKRGTVSYEMKPVDLKELVKEEIIKTKPQAEERKLALEVSMDESQTYMVNLDRAQFSEHVIRNLTDNAIKYTPLEPTGVKDTLPLTGQAPHGSILIKLAHAGNKIVFSVKDTGVGITNEDKAHLFTEGGRGKESLTVNVHSTGYGLYIAKNIVEAHGGRIWAESSGPGKGSTFFVELPAV